MTTTISIPDSLRDLLEQERSQAISEIRRLTRCSPREAQELLGCLGNGVEAVVKYPDRVAALVGDPQPRWLSAFRGQRSLILRTLRRGNRLAVMRLLDEGAVMSPSEARQFALALTGQGHNWQRLEKLYASPPEDFWVQRPLPEPPQEPEISMLFPPQEFSPDLLLEWLGQGHYRTCVTWVRQSSGRPREECQALVDRLDELIFDDHPNPWESVTPQWPEMIAALAGMPNPTWLRQLGPQRREIFELLGERRVLKAAELIRQTLSCSSQEARRFLRQLGEDEVCWVKTETAFLMGKVFRKARVVAAISPPPPAPVVSAPVAVEVGPDPAPDSVDDLIETAPQPITSETLCGPGDEHLSLGVTQVRTMPWASSRDQETQNTRDDRQAHDAKRSRELDEEAQALKTSRAQDTEATRSEILLPAAGSQPPAASSIPVSAPTPLPLVAKPFTLDDTDQLVERLAQLGKACKEQDLVEAVRVFGELESAGFNRTWVSERYPSLLPFLPEEPWSRSLAQLGPLADSLSKVASGQVSAVQVAQDALRASQLGSIVGALERAWKTKKKDDLEKAVGLLQEHPHLAEEINKKVPWLAELMDLDKDGTSDIIEIATDPGAYFSDLLEARFPELQKRLGEARIQSIKEALPELMQAMKDRNMRGVMRQMSRLRLGPSDVKSLLGVLREMHR